MMLGASSCHCAKFYHYQKHCKVLQVMFCVTENAGIVSRILYGLPISQFSQISVVIFEDWVTDVKLVSD